MDDWKLIWNSFCDEVAESVQKNNLEKVFEEDIARDFFTTLGWNRFKKELKEQYSVKFATATHRADFALFKMGKETPEVIIELKRDGLVFSPVLEMLRQLHIHPHGFSKYCMGAALTNQSLPVNRFRQKLRDVEKILAAKD